MLELSDGGFAMGVDEYLRMNTTGFIECEHADHKAESKLWCEHIEEDMRTGEDVQFFWPENAEQRELITLQMPMFPTSDLWAQVDLEKVDNDFMQMYVVKWISPTTLEKVDITFLTRGDTRMTIREALWRHCCDDPDREKHCKSSSHGYAQEMHWQNEQRRNPAACIWCLYQYKQCFACVKSMDFDEFVPEKEGSPWSK
jgi:hypothetical protein